MCEGISVQQPPQRFGTLVFISFGRSAVGDESNISHSVILVGYLGFCLRVCVCQPECCVRVGSYHPPPPQIVYLTNSVYSSDPTWIWVRACGMFANKYATYALVHHTGAVISLVFDPRSVYSGNDVRNTYVEQHSAYVQHVVLTRYGLGRNMHTFWHGIRV